MFARRPAVPRFARPVLLMFAGLLLTCAAQAQAVTFDIPAQPAATALLAFSQQSGCDVLFSYDELTGVKAAAVTGRHTPDFALAQMLRGTGFAAHRNGGRQFVVTRLQPAPGGIRGRLLVADGSPAAGVSIRLSGTARATVTDDAGQFTLDELKPGVYALAALADGSQALQWAHVTVAAGRMTLLAPQRLREPGDPRLMAPFIVEAGSAEDALPASRVPLPRIAAGDLDLPRFADDPLPYHVYHRDQIVRSGAVDLNQFLQRELLASYASALPPEQSGAQASYLVGSTNLNLRGYGSDATVVLVNGRRLPESVVAMDGGLGAPDVNTIPLSLVQRIEVLPASAAALYTGNPVGGVINIILRPDINHTELTTTYTNALGGFDAPESVVSLQYGRSLLRNRLRLRLNLAETRALPPTEAELDYHRSNIHDLAFPNGAIYRATPNVRSASGQPLFGPGTPAFTSVAPGADGSGRLTTFAGRQGLRNLALFDSPGGFAASPDSMDNPYGRRQRRQSFYLSGTFDALPSLQLGLDTMFTRTVVNRGYDVLTGDLALPAGSPFNPFHQDLLVSLNETAPRLGEDYSEARVQMFSSVAAAILKLPADWRVTLDAQFSRNTVRYRGLAGVDVTRWQQLVDQGLYNPLRDTQVFGPPPAFYDRALIYYGQPGRFAKLGDYNVLDTAVRVTNQHLPLPTGESTAALGFDYRRSQLKDFRQELRYADGGLARPPVAWDGRTLERLSVFGELQAPVLPQSKLPSWLTGFTTDSALRYIFSASSRESNLAPTLGFKIDFTGGLFFRGSATYANSFPPVAMSRRVISDAGGPAVEQAVIYDPRRDQSYTVAVNQDLSPAVVPEASVTQSAGLGFKRGSEHQFLLRLDFFDTRKTNELILLQPQAVMNLESLWPDRVARAPLAPGDPAPAGYVTSLVTGLINASWRHSQNWDASADYTWTRCFGGRLDAYGRLVWFQSYQRRVLPDTPVVDELSNPDGISDVAGLQKYRASFGASWSGPRYGFGVDSRYYGARRLPVVERAAQGGDGVAPYWQFDAFVQTDLGPWLPWFSRGRSLKLLLRVNNLLDARFPRYANDPSGAGAQAYGDWRGRTYTVSVTAAF